MESLVNGHWQVLGEYDRQHHIKLIADEWGAWYKPGGEMTRKYFGADSYIA